MYEYFDIRKPQFCGYTLFIENPRRGWGNWLATNRCFWRWKRRIFPHTALRKWVSPEALITRWRTGKAFRQTPSTSSAPCWNAKFPTSWNSCQNKSEVYTALSESNELEKVVLWSATSPCSGRWRKRASRHTGCSKWGFPSRITTPWSTGKTCPPIPSMSCVFCWNAMCPILWNSNPNRIERPDNRRAASDR